MSRTYHLALVAFAADADPKWVDNLLSHFDIPGVELAGAGVPRRISTTGVYHVALVRILNRDASFPVHAAVELAHRLLSGNRTIIGIGHAIELRFDHHVFRQKIDARIAEGVDAIAPRRRGRPPARQSST